MRTTLILFAASFVLFSASNYGGMRSPDSEIVFRVGESIASGHGFAVEKELALWQGFGVSTGRDGRRYAIFGPLQSVAAAPLVACASRINETRWYDHAGRLPVSFYAGRGLVDYLRLRQPAELAPHALRFIVSFFNALIAALCVLAFYMIARMLVRSKTAALMGSILFGSGTLLWPYAGTFFSEPLATLFVLSSFHQLVSSDQTFGAPGSARGWRHLFIAGVCLGLAGAAHITALLFLPFFALYAWRVGVPPAGRDLRRPLALLLLFSAGAALMLGLLGAYNFIRFGNALQTGRSVGMESIVTTEYSRFVAPWRGLWALLVSPGKGLLFYCPAVIAGVASWPRLHWRRPFLSLMLAGAAALRLIVIASRSDWHGGFSLGPRYLVMLIPFLMLPVLFWLEEQLEAKKVRRAGAFIIVSLLCASQQLYFVLGELFSSCQLIKMKYAERGINIFANDRLYLDWGLSPLFILIRARIAPFWLQASSVDVGTIWIVGSLLLAGAAAAAFLLIARGMRAGG